MKKVLVADDEEAVRGLVVPTVGDDGRFRLILAEDGAQALETARRKKPDLVFLEVRMPKMNGFEVCWELKEELETASIKVIFLIALAQESDPQQAASVEADGFFPSPSSAPRGHRSSGATPGSCARGGER